MKPENRRFFDRKVNRLIPAAILATVIGSAPMKHAEGQEIDPRPNLVPAELCRLVKDDKNIINGIRITSHYEIYSAKSVFGDQAIRIEGAMVGEKQNFMGYANSITNAVRSERLSGTSIYAVQEETLNGTITNYSAAVVENPPTNQLDEFFNSGNGDCVNGFVPRDVFIAPPGLPYLKTEAGKTVYETSANVAASLKMPFASSTIQIVPLE